MAKRGIVDHPKLISLAIALDIPEPYAVGVLECLWQWSARYHADGEITGPATLLARCIRYPGDAEALIEALASAGFVDRDGDRLLVHDWPEHCEDAVHLTLARAGRRFADGSTPNISRLSQAERQRVEELYSAAESRDPAPPEAGSEPENGASAHRAHKKRTESAQKAHESVLKAHQPLPLPPEGSDIYHSPPESGSGVTLPGTVTARARARERPPPTPREPDGDINRLDPEPDNPNIRANAGLSRISETLARIAAASRRQSGQARAP